jgi:acetolactate synthase I/II/III large subunit
MTTQGTNHLSTVRELSGGAAIAEMFIAHGASVMFGMAGFQLLPLYDAFQRSDGRLRHILVHDERDGAFMADAYARVAGRPGLCDGTLGPGATNLITGLAESLGASVPVVAVAGEVNSGIAGRGATQESDQFSMIRPAVKTALQVDRVDRIPELVRAAFRIATSGRPGPTLLNVREDAAHAVNAFDASDFYTDVKTSPARRIRADDVDITDAADLLVSSERPVIVAGGGIHLSGAYAELERFAQLLQAPVATTISGKGAVPEDHALAIGVCGRFSRTANDLIDRSDCVIVVGSKLGEIATNRWSVLPNSAAVIQLDIDAAALGKTVPVAVGLWADARLGLRDLSDAVAGGPPVAPSLRRVDYIREVTDRKTHWRAEHAARMRSSAVPVHQARLLNDLTETLPSDAIVVADGGFAAHWSAIYYEARAAGRHYIANRGHASIGYGLPGALGAKCAAPDRPVIGITGDGGLTMSIGEIETAVREHLPVIIVVVDNEAQGYVKALQHSLYAGRYQSADFAPIDYARVANEMGAFGQRVTSPDEFTPALRAALESDRVSVIDVMVTRDPAQMLPGVDSRTAQKHTDSAGSAGTWKAVARGTGSRGPST